MNTQTEALKAVLDLIPNAEAKDFWNRVYSGKFTPQDLANELSDFHVMIENVPKVYMAVTGGLLSKQMYDADVVIAKFNDYVDDIVQENVKEALEQPVKKVKVKYFENEGYVDYGYYLFLDDKPETIENTQDSRYPHQLVFSSAESALTHVLETKYGIEVCYE